MFIYKTTNLINGKIYIGEHNGKYTNYLGSGKILKLAIKKYGKENFKREIIEECETLEELDEREIYWIEFYNSRDKKVGYNIREGGGLNGGKYDMSGPNNPMYGKTHTDEVKKIISLKQKRTYLEKYGEELSFKMKKDKSEKYMGSGNPTYGKTLEKCKCEICGKIVDIRNYGRWHGKNCKPRIKKEKRPKTGFKQTEETKRKISEALKGRVFSDIHKDKLLKILEKNRNGVLKNKYTCQYCGKITNKSNNIRWHGENCKNK